MLRISASILAESSKELIGKVCAGSCVQRFTEGFPARVAKGDVIHTHTLQRCVVPSPLSSYLGPVNKVQDDSGYHARMSLTTSDQTTYETKDWAPISFMKVKACQPRLEKCTRTVVVLGSNKERKKKARIRKRKNRCKKYRP